MAPKKKDDIKVRPKDELSTIIGGEGPETREQIKQKLDNDNVIDYSDIESMSDAELLGFVDEDERKAKISRQRYFDMLRKGEIINDDNADREIAKRLGGEVKNEMKKIKALKVDLKREKNQEKINEIQSRINAANKRIKQRQFQAETLIQRLTEENLKSAVA